jgi:hypothetical protein
VTSEPGMVRRYTWSLAGPPCWMSKTQAAILEEVQAAWSGHMKAFRQ